MGLTDPDQADREVLAAVVETWDADLLAADPLGREVGSSGVVTGWRVRVADKAGTASDHVLYLEDWPPGAESPTGRLRLVDRTGTVREIWRYPDDPALPALAAIVYPDAASAVLRRLGVDTEVRSLRLAAYRPGKRAVVRITTTDGDLFAKVVPPGRADRIVAQHRLWRESGLPSPTVVAWSRDGLILLGALPGTPVSTALPHADLEQLLRGIRSLRQAIGRVPSLDAARPSLASRLDWYRDRAIGLAPQLALEITETVAAATRRRDAGGPPPAIGTVHGDLHLGQLLVDADGCRVIGVLDIDTAGRGDPADDDAALWAHVAVIAESGLPAANRLADILRSQWSDGEAAHRDRVAAAAAATLLGHGLSGHLPLERAAQLARAVAEEPAVDRRQPR